MVFFLLEGGGRLLRVEGLLSRVAAWLPRA